MIVTLKFYAFFPFFNFYTLYVHDISCIEYNKKMYLICLGIILNLRIFMDNLIKFYVNYEPIWNILPCLRWDSAFGTRAQTHWAVLSMWDTQARINHRTDLAVASGPWSPKGLELQPVFFVQPVTHSKQLPQVIWNGFSQVFQATQWLYWFMFILIMH